MRDDREAIEMEEDEEWRRKVTEEAGAKAQERPDNWGGVLGMLWGGGMMWSLNADLMGLRGAGGRGGVRDVEGGEPEPEEPDQGPTE